MGLFTLDHQAFLHVETGAADMTLSPPMDSCISIYSWFIRFRSKCCIEIRNYIQTL